MALTHPLLQVSGLVFVGFRCGVPAVGGGARRLLACTDLKLVELTVACHLSKF